MFICYINVLVTIPFAFKIMHGLVTEDVLRVLIVQPVGTSRKTLPCKMLVGKLCHFNVYNRIVIKRLKSGSCFRYLYNRLTFSTRSIVIRIQ